MKHESKKLGNVLQSVLKEIDAYDNYAKLYVIQNWHEVMIKPISDICRPIKFEHDVLFIEAKSESWANELQRFKKEMIEILNRKFNQLNVRDIKIV